MRWKRGRQLLLWAGAAGALGGCAGPKLVTGITERDQEAKFVYVQHRSGVQGVVECKVATDGSLSQCADKPIHFKE